MARFKKLQGLFTPTDAIQSEGEGHECALIERRREGEQRRNRLLKLSKLNRKTSAINWWPTGSMPSQDLQS